MNETSVIHSIQKLRYFLTPKEKKKWLGIVCFALCVSLLEVAAASTVILFASILNKPELGKHYLGYLNVGQDLTNQQFIFLSTILCASIFIIKNTLGAFEVFFQNYSIQQMNFDFKNRLLNTYANLDYNYYLRRNTSYGSSVVGGDAEVIFSIGMVSLASIVSESIVFLCLIIMITLVNPSLFFTILGLSLIIGFCVHKWCMPFFYKWGQSLQDARLLSSQNLGQFFHAYKEIVILNKCQAFINSYLKHVKKTCEIQAFATAANMIPRLIIEVIFVGLFAVVVGYVCIKQNNPQALLGVLGGYLYVGFRLMPGLNRIITQLNSYKSIMPNINRVYAETKIALEQETNLDISEFTFNESINIKNLDFSYHNTNKNALKNINITIQRGECIGVVGETGSGKSTLIDIILGLLKPSHGFIHIDNKFPAHCKQWHQEIGYVPQSLYLTDDTILSNIAFGEKLEDVQQERLMKAISDAQLKTLIMGLPEGLQTIVGERGIRLSGGERQRIAIARALYRNPSVLIFDEATSSLDNATEERLMETIQEISKNRTVIMVAHRITTLKNCDRIIVMQHGSIKEIIDYDTLCQKHMRSSELN